MTVPAAQVIEDVVSVLTANGETHWTYIRHGRVAAQTMCGLPAGERVTKPDGVKRVITQCPRCREVARAQADAWGRQINEANWIRGNLRWLLDAAQQKVYDAAKAAWGLSGGQREPEPDPSLEEMTEAHLDALPDTTYGALCSRRFGKSTIATAIAAEIAIRTPGVNIFYAAKDRADAQSIASKIWQDVFAKSCPDAVKPKYDEHKGVMTFPNRSVIVFAGVNDQKAEDMRGYVAHLFICDEIGSWQSPNYVISSIMLPAISTTNGSVLVLTTPASTPNHESTAILQDLDRNGRLSKHTIIDSKRLTNLRKVFYLWKAGEQKQHALEVVRSGGMTLPKTSTARREYFVMFEVDSNALVLPEAREVEFVVKVTRRAA